MSAKPLIGLTATRLHNSFGHPMYTVNLAYTKSISAAGGLPVLIPLNLSTQDLNTLLSHLDGILFTGGYDINPQQYGNLPHPKAEGIDDARDNLEIYLAQAIVRTAKPFFGICRGIQLINVAFGGSLYEDLPEQFPGNVRHDNHDLPRDHLAHAVEVERGSRLGQILGTNETQVNSLHHQGVRRLAEELKPTAHAPDDLVEAFEIPEHSFGLAVQWHPEELQAHEPMRKLFRAFVQSCQNVKSNPAELGV